MAIKSPLMQAKLFFGKTILTNNVDAKHILVMIKITLQIRKMSAQNIQDFHVITFNY